MPGPYHWLIDHSFSHRGAIVQSLSPAQTFSTPWTVHAKLPCPSLSPWACSNLFPLSQWCHPTISFSVALFSSCPQSFSVSGPFPKSLHVRWPKYWSFSLNISLSIEYSELISFRTDWFDPAVSRGSQQSSPAPQFESINSLVLSLLYCPTLTTVCEWLLEKP